MAMGYLYIWVGSKDVPQVSLFLSHFSGDFSNL